MVILARAPPIPPISEHRRFFASPEIGGIGGDNCIYTKLCNSLTVTLTAIIRYVSKRAVMVAEWISCLDKRYVLIM